MINPPKPDREGEFKFVEKTGKGKRNLIDSYPISQTIANLNEKIMATYNEEREKAEAAGNSKANAVSATQTVAKKLPEFSAVQKGLDNEAEIQLKKKIEEIINKHNIGELIIHSLSMKAISSLNDLGLKLPGDGEIDLLVAYASGDFLHVIVCEVKRVDTYLWQKKCYRPNKQSEQGREPTDQRCGGRDGHLGRAITKPDHFQYSGLLP